MERKAWIIIEPRQPAWLIERTKRSIEAQGWTVCGAATFAEIIEQTEGDVWLLKAGAWVPRTERSEAPIFNALDKPLLLIGATLTEPLEPTNLSAPTTNWERWLRTTGGVLNPVQAPALPAVHSLWINAAALRQCCQTPEVTDLSSALHYAAAHGWRALRHADMDVCSSAGLRVLQVITSLQRGGAERLAIDLHNDLQRQGIGARMLTLGSPSRAPFAAPMGLIERRLPPDATLRAEVVCLVAGALGTDVIHAHLLDAKTLEHIAARTHPLLVTLHNQSQGWPVGYELESATSATNQRNTLLVGCAETVSAELRAAMPGTTVRTAWNSVQPLPRGSEMGAQGKAWRKKVGAAPEDIVLVAVANLRPQKRLSLLPSIAAATRELTGRKVWLLIAGEPSVFDPTAKQESDAVWDAVRHFEVPTVWEGAADDVRGLLAAADVFVSTSAWEGLSLAQLEALDAGVPVVATQVGGVQEIDSTALHLVPAEAAAADFATAIAKALTGPRGSLPRAFTTPVMTARYRWLYHSLLAQCQSQHRPQGLILVTNNFSTGGAQSSARRLLLALHGMGEKVSAVVLQEQPDNPTLGTRALREAGISVLCLEPPELCPDAAMALEPLLDSLAERLPESILFWNVIPEYKLLLSDALWQVRLFDVSPGEMLFSSLQRYFKAPRVGLPESSLKAYGERLAGFVVKYQAEAERARASFSCTVSVIPNGVPSQPQRQGTDSIEHVVIGTSARLHPQKRLEDLLAAFRLLHAAMPTVRLSIAGGVDSDTSTYASELRASSQDLPVDWLGEVQDVPGFLQQLDVFAMISEPAGCPNASLEAMACGLPIVATAVGGAVDQIIHGNTGLLVPARDAPAFAEALHQLCIDPIQRAKMGPAAWLRARQEFSIEGMAKAYRSVLLGR